MRRQFFQGLVGIVLSLILWAVAIGYFLIFADFLRIMPPIASSFGTLITVAIFVLWCIISSERVWRSADFAHMYARFISLLGVELAFLPFILIVNWETNYWLVGLLTSLGLLTGVTYLIIKNRGLKASKKRANRY